MLNTEPAGATQERDPRVVRDSGTQKNQQNIQHHHQGRYQGATKGSFWCYLNPRRALQWVRSWVEMDGRGPQQQDRQNNRASKERLRRPQCGDKEEEGKASPHPRGGNAGGADLSLTKSHNAKPRGTSRKQEVGLREV